MDVQLQELIDKIKKDGVASAEAQAKKIIAEAEKKAISIINDAEEKADSIIKSAKAETARMEKASEDAITQAGRNLIITFRDGINKELSAIINEQTDKAYDKDLLKKLIPETVKAWSDKKEAESLSVLLPSKDLKALETSLKSALKAQIKKGLEIKGDASLSSGFRIGTKNGEAFYDFSAEEVAGLFSAYLNPKTTELMKKAAASLNADNTAEESGAAVKEEKILPAEKKPAKKSASAASGKKPAAKKPAEKNSAKKGKK